MKTSQKEMMACLRKMETRIERYQEQLEALFGVSLVRWRPASKRLRQSSNQNGSLSRRDESGD
jgi:hypothetical protein